VGMIQKLRFGLEPVSVGKSMYETIVDRKLGVNLRCYKFNIFKFVGV
jgi:hypothetical protein